MEDEEGKDKAEIRALTERYKVAAHAMQSGVAIEMNSFATMSATEPKHLRVGVNTAHADIGSLARLLIAKGLFTELEFTRALAEGMEREADRYEKRLGVKLG